MRSRSVKKALEWFADHGGDGAMTIGCATILAQGEVGPFDRATWQRLADLGMIEFYGGARHGGKGPGRARITDKGRKA
jgi:hypothetical protein